MTVYLENESETVKISETRIMLVDGENNTYKVRYALKADSAAAPTDESEYLLAYPTVTKAGSYKLYFIVEATNHETEKGEISVTVIKDEDIYEIVISKPVTKTYGNAVLTSEEIYNEIKSGMSWLKNGKTLDKTNNAELIAALEASLKFTVVNSNGTSVAELLNTKGLLDAGAYTILVKSTYSENEYYDENDVVTFANDCNVNAYIVEKLVVTVTIGTVETTYGDWTNAKVADELKALLAGHVSGDLLGSDLEITLSLDVISLPTSGLLAANEEGYKIKATYNTEAKNYTISEASDFGKVIVKKAEIGVDTTAINLYEKPETVQVVGIDDSRITLVGTDSKAIVKYALVKEGSAEPATGAYTETEPSVEFGAGEYRLYFIVEAANHNSASGYIVVTVESMVYEVSFSEQIKTTYGETVLTQLELIEKIKKTGYGWTANGEPVEDAEIIAALERAITLSVVASNGKVYNSGDLIPVGTYTVKVEGKYGSSSIAFANECNINAYVVEKRTVTVTVATKTITYGDWENANVAEELKALLTVTGDYAGSTFAVALSLDAVLPETGYLAAYEKGYQIIGTPNDTSNYDIVIANGAYGKLIVKAAPIGVDKSGITLYASEKNQTVEISGNRLTLVDNAEVKIRYALVEGTGEAPADDVFTLVAPTRKFNAAGSYRLYYIIEAANHETARSYIEITVTGEVVYELEFTGTVDGGNYGDKILTKEELLAAIMEMNPAWTANGEAVSEDETIEALFNAITLSVVDGNGEAVSGIINAGTYTIKVEGSYNSSKITFANYCNLNAYVVERLEVTITLNDTTIHYGDWLNAEVDEELQNLLIKNVSGDFLGSDLEITLALDVTSLPTSGYLAVGEYQIKASYNTAAKNYTVSENSVFGKVIVEKAEIQVDESAINLYYIKDKVQTVSIELTRLTLVDKENAKVVIKYALVGADDEAPALSAYTETQPSRVFEMGSYKLYYIVEAANHEPADGYIDVIVEGRVYEIEFTDSVDGGQYGDKVPSQADILSAIEEGAVWYENGVDISSNKTLVNALKAAITITIVDSEGNEYHSGDLIPAGTYTIKITGSYNYNSKNPELLAPISFVGACNINAYKVAQREVTVTLELPESITYGDWENANVANELKNLLTIQGDFAGSTLAIELSLDHEIPAEGYLAAYEKGYQVIGAPSDTVNYKLVVTNGTYGKLVVKKADIHVDKAEIITLNANKDAQTVKISENRITLVGEEYNRDSVTVRYALVEDGSSAAKPDDSVYTSNELSHVFDGEANYRLYFIVEADNHNRADGYILIEVKEGEALYEISFTGKINKTFGDEILESADLLTALKALIGFKWLKDGKDFTDAERITALEEAITLSVVDSEGKPVSGTLNAGSYTIKVEGTYDHDQYNDPITFAGGCNINAYVVAQRKVTVTVSDDRVEYGKLTTADVASKLAELAVGAIAGDYEGSSLEITLALDTNLPDSTYLAVGTYAIRGTSNDTAKNYVITWQLGSLTVTPATIEDAQVTGYTGDYDGAAHDVVAMKKATTIDNAELLWTYSLDGSTWVESLKALNVTNGPVTVAFKAVDVNGNHYEATGSFTYEVTPLEVEITLPEIDAVTYGGDNWTETNLAIAIEALTDELDVKDKSGKALPDAVSQVITLNLQGVTFSSGGYLKVGTYAIVISTAEGVGSKASNYTITISEEVKNRSLVIKQREVSVNGIKAENKIYDKTTTVNFLTANAVISGLAEGDDLDILVSGEFDSVNVGKYSIGIEIKLTGDDASNYLLDVGDSQTQVQNVEIMARKLTVTWNLDALEDGSTYYYNGKAPEIYAVLDTSNVLDGDSVRLGEIKGLSPNKGPHEVYYLLDGSDANNYEIVDGTAEYTVIFKSITITFTDDIVATYGEDAQNASQSAKLTGWTSSEPLTGEGLPTVSVKFKVNFGDAVENGFAKVGKYAIVLDSECNIEDYYEVEVIGWFVVKAADVLVKRTEFNFYESEANKAAELKDSDIILQGSTKYENLEITYSIDDVNGTYTAGPVQISNTCTLYYKIVDKTGNHNEATGSITVTVTEQYYEITISGTPKYFTYGETFVDGKTLFEQFTVDKITLKSADSQNSEVDESTKSAILAEISVVVSGNGIILANGSKPDAGVYSITVSGTYNSINIVLADGNGIGALVVNKKAGTVNWNLGEIQDNIYKKKFDNAAIETLPVVSGLEEGEYEIRYAKGGMTVTAAEYGLHVGEYVVTVLVDTKNYTVDKDTLTVIVEALSLTVTINNQSATYGDWSEKNAAEKLAQLVQEGLSGDTTLPDGITLDKLFTISIENANYSTSGYLLAGTTYNIVIDILTEDFEIHFNTATLTVDKRTVTFEGTVEANDRDYDGTKNATLKVTNGDPNGLVEGDELSFVFSGVFESANAAASVNVNVTITLDGADKDNYSFTDPELSGISAEIRKIELTVYWNTDNLTQPDGKWTHVYNGYQPDISAEIADAGKIVAGEASAVRVTAVKCDETATDVRTEGYRFYVELEDTAESVNYVIKGADITVYIVAATIEVKFQDVTMYENGDAQNVSLNTADVVLKGMGNTATITYVINKDATDPASSEYESTVTVTTEGTYYLHYKVEAANHETLYGHVTLTVKAAKLVVTINVITKTYGVKAPTFEELKDEQLSIKSADFDGTSVTDFTGILAKITNVSIKGVSAGTVPNAGSYDIEIVADRYEFMGYKLEIVFANGANAYVIDKKVVEIDWHLDDNDKVTMGQEGNYTAEYGVTFTEPTITTGVEGGTQCLLEVKYVRSGVDAKTDYLGSRPNAGVYTLTVVANNDPNYALPENFEVTVEVTKIELLITIGNATAEYNRYATGSILNAQISRLVTLRGDLEKVLDGEDISEIVILSVEGVGTGKLNAGKYAIVGIQLGGGYADNYNVTFTGTWSEAGAYLGKAGVFEVTPLIITITGVTAEDKDYDGTVKVQFNYSAMVINGVIYGDTVTATAVGQFADRHAGKDKIVEVIRYELAGADAINYIVDMDHSTYELTAEIRSIEMDNPSLNPDIGDGNGNTEYDPDTSLDDILDGFEKGQQDVDVKDKESGGDIHFTTDDEGNTKTEVTDGDGRTTTTVVTDEDGNVKSVTTQTEDENGNRVTHETEFDGPDDKEGRTTTKVEMPKDDPKKPGDSKTTVTTYPDGSTTTETETIVDNGDGSTTHTDVVTETDKDGNVTRKKTETTVEYPDGSKTTDTVETDKDGNMTTTHTDKLGNTTTIVTNANGGVVSTKVVDRNKKNGRIDWTDGARTQGSIKDGDGVEIATVEIRQLTRAAATYTVIITDKDGSSSSATTDGDGNIKSEVTDGDGKSKGSTEVTTDPETGKTETEVKDGKGSTVTDVTSDPEKGETEVKDGNGKTTGSTTTTTDPKTGETNTEVKDGNGNTTTDMTTKSDGNGGVDSTVTDKDGNTSSSSTKKDEEGNVETTVTDKDGKTTGAGTNKDGEPTLPPGNYEMEVKPKDEGDASFKDSEKDNSFELNIEKGKLAVPVKSLFADNLTAEQLESIFILQANGTYLISPEHITEIIMNYDSKTMGYTAVKVGNEYIVTVRILNGNKYMWADGSEGLTKTFTFSVEVPEVPGDNNTGAGFKLDTTTLLIIAIIVILLIFIIVLISMSRKNKKALEAALKAASENNANIYYGDYYEGGYDETGFDDYYEGDDWEDFVE
ncbi:MAG: hypothetical protein J1G05_00510 [Clostridiales bacterium]|nr:hypothetical protein [Clostridiales bacterium]